MSNKHHLIWHFYMFNKARVKGLIFLFVINKNCSTNKKLAYIITWSAKLRLQWVGYKVMRKKHEGACWHFSFFDFFLLNNIKISLTSVCRPVEFNELHATTLYLSLWLFIYLFFTTRHICITFFIVTDRY